MQFGIGDVGEERVQQLGGAQRIAALANVAFEQRSRRVVPLAIGKGMQISGNAEKQVEVRRGSQSSSCFRPRRTGRSRSDRRATSG